MIKLNCFYDFARFEAFDADAHSFRDAVHDSPDGFKVWEESAGSYTGYLLADAAFLFGEPAAGYGPARGWLFTAYFAYS